MKTILLAHDASQAFQEALADATTLAHRLGAEILLAQIQSPEDAPLNGRAKSLYERRYAEGELEEIKKSLHEAGLNCRIFLRMGAIGDSLVNLCAEEKVDLIMLAAYGYGEQDRHALGSTAEHLLSNLPCPAMVYGPSVDHRFSTGAFEHPILFAVLPPLSASQVSKAIQLARLFGVPIEVLHVAENAGPGALKRLETECKKLAELLASSGVKSTWSVLTGSPSKTIVEQSSRIGCPLTLLSLKYRHIMAADRIAAHVIRASGVPVLTYSVKE